MSRDDDRTKAFEKRARICMKCGDVLTGRAYTGAHQERSLKVRMVSKDHRGMHKECAEAWVEQTRATPENSHLIPEVATAEARFRTAVELGSIQIERIQNEIRARDAELVHAIWTYHGKSSNSLKGVPEREKKPLPPCPWDASTACPGLIEEVRGKISITRELLSVVADALDGRLSPYSLPSVENPARTAHLEATVIVDLLAKIRGILNQATVHGIRGQASVHTLKRSAVGLEPKMEQRKLGTHCGISSCQRAITGLEDGRLVRGLESTYCVQCFDEKGGEEALLLEHIEFCERWVLSARKTSDERIAVCEAALREIRGRHLFVVVPFPGKA